MTIPPALEICVYIYFCCPDGDSVARAKREKEHSWKGNERVDWVALATRECGRWDEAALGGR